VFIPTIEIVKTKASFLGIEVVTGNYADFFKNHDPKDFFGIIVQTPDRKGVLHDFTVFFNEFDKAQSKTIKCVASDLLALTLTKPPG